MTYKQCDCCGKYIEEYIEENKLYVSSRLGDNFDLCRECDKELYNKLMTMRKKALADIENKGMQDGDD